ARHLFAARDPWWRGSSGPVRPQSRRLAASGYRMAYRVSSCRRGIPPGVALRDAAVFARALQHLFPLSCSGRSSARPSRSSLFGARGDPGRSTGSRRGLMEAEVKSTASPVGGACLRDRCRAVVEWTAERVAEGRARDSQVVGNVALTLSLCGGPCMRIPRLLVGVAGVALCVGSAAAQEKVESSKARADTAPSFTSVTDQMLLDARQSGSNWVTYGRDYWNQRWSPLTQINTSNVGTLHMSWMYQTGISRLGSFETSPIVIDGVMYLTTPYNTAMAVNARTGKEIWRYEHKQSIASPIYCCGPNNRGVAISGGTVYMATLDAHLVALDAKTGAV